MKNRLYLSFLILFLATPALAVPVELKDDTARLSYSLGYQIGGDFRKQGVDINADAVIQGIQDALAAEAPRLPAQEMKKLLVALKSKVVAEQRQRIVQNSSVFMDANLKKEGVKQLPGGSQYRVIKSGSGKSPTLQDLVDIHFTTARSDGTPFASTYGEEKPRTYLVQKMLPGLQQALLKMKPGAKWEVFLPPAARGEKLESAGILIYELELIAVHPAEG